MSVRDTYYFPPVETHLLRSKYVPQTFRIDVMLPLQRRGDTRRFPVVYVTDGNAVFDLFKSISWLMQQSEREAPPFILVAIGYPSDTPMAGSLLRERDLTFAGCPNFRGLEVSLEGVATIGKGEKDFDGAEDFQRFMGEELFVFIERHYPAMPLDRAYFGHSSGARFGLFTLFTQTHLFRNYITSSPAVLFHGTTPDGTRYENHEFMLERARAFAASGKSLHGVRLYLSAGTEEEFEPELAHWRITSGYYRLAALLKAAAIPGLTLITEVLVGESHTTTWPIAFMHGIRAVLGSQINLAEARELQP
jgi:predicted alpha/beta superfamily hydrolase